MHAWKSSLVMHAVHQAVAIVTQDGIMFSSVHFDLITKEWDLQYRGFHGGPWSH